MTQEQIAKTKDEWWELMRNKLSSFNSGKHPDDQLTLLDFVGEYLGEEVFGWTPFRNFRGGLDIKNSEFDSEESEDDFEDSYDDDEEYFTNESKDETQRYVDEEDD